MGNEKSYISASQIRAARAILNWSQDALAEKTDLSITTIRKIESGHISPRDTTNEKIRNAFECAGLEFINPDGVRRKPEEITVYEGREGFNEFYDFLYKHLLKNGGEVCIGGVDEALFFKHRLNPEADIALHRQRMLQLVHRNKDFLMRILVKEGDYNFTAASYATYRWQKSEYFLPFAFYAFGNCLALISFTHEPAPHVTVLTSAPLAEAYRRSFQLAWDMAKPPLQPQTKKKPHA